MRFCSKMMRDLKIGLAIGRAAIQVDYIYIIF
jgi:hypothetical protein